MRIIPAIDLLNGKCVRLSMGNYDESKVYNDNPVEVAINFENKGIKYLHIVDLDGAKQGKLINFEIIKKITSNTNLKIDFGGGIREEETIIKLFDIGVDSLTLGSIAVKKPNFAIEMVKKYGSDKIILGADLKNDKPSFEGWQKEKDINGLEFIGFYMRNGFKKIICTDISRDGMMIGPSYDLYRRIINYFPCVELVASGGISNLEDLKELKKIGMFGAIIGKALYEGAIKLEDLNAL